jgi:hypothetical protein
VILYRSQDQDLTGEKDRGGGELTVARVSGHLLRRGAQRVDGGGVVATPR